MSEVPQIFFRFATRLFAVLLGVLSIWLLLSELSRPGIERLPTDPASAAMAAKWRSAAAFAASIGIIRGDLWAESAFTYSDLLWGTGGPSADLTQTLRHARISAENALRLAPHQSGAWLFLAALTSHHPSQGFDPTESLRMSYYTGPSERDLMPLRLRLMARLDAFGDSELQQFASWDLRTLIARKQTSEIAEAYREASSAGKRFIEQTVADIDPSVVETVRSQAQEHAPN
jgi:hypothetical protein